MKKFYDAVKMIFQSACVFSVSTGTQIELELMRTANNDRENNGLSRAYNEDHFNALFKAHNNAVQEIVNAKEEI